MSLEKPVIALVPGAWLPPSSYEELLVHLQGAGYQTAHVELPSLNPQNPSECTIERDAEHIRSTLLVPLIEGQERDVVLLMHSYGSEPAGVAAFELGKYERSEAGRKGGVVGYVAISAFILTAGASCADGQGGNLPPWVLQHTPSQDLTMPDKPGEYLFNEVPQSISAHLEAQILPHARGPFYQPQPKTAWSDPSFDGCRGYVMCKDDKAVILEGQKAMVKYSGCTWETVEISGGHCAYVGTPPVVGVAVIKLVQSFRSPV